jgi:hypothetical protein
MKKINVSLYAFCVMAVAGLTVAPSTMMATPVAAAQHDANTAKLTPQQATDNLVKELGLNSSQAKKLKKLNEKYAELIANPRFKGKPQPATDNQKKAVDGKTGATSHEDGNAKKSADEQAHIKSQHQKRNAYNAELKKILTSAQYKKYLGK